MAASAQQCCSFFSTISFKSSKPIQIGPCMLMPLSIHLHGLHLNAQYAQTRHLSTQSRSEERSGHRLLWSTTLLLPILLSDSQISISLVSCHIWSLMNHFRTSQGPCLANLHKWCGVAFPMEWMCVATYILNAESINACRCGVANKSRMI